MKNLDKSFTLNGMEELKAIFPGFWDAALQDPEIAKPVEEDDWPVNGRGKMVGATGFEPVTSTM